MFQEKKMQKHSNHTTNIKKSFLQDLPKSGRFLSETREVLSTTIFLKRMFSFHQELMFSLAGRLIDIAEYEIKIELAHHLFYHSLSANRLRERLLELRVRERELYQTDTRIKNLFDEIKSSQNTFYFVAAIYKELLPSMRNFYKTFLVRTCDLLEFPTTHHIRHILFDLTIMEEYGKQLIDAYKAYDFFDSSSKSWCDHVQSLIQAVVGVNDDTKCRSESRHGQIVFTRKIECQRDQRFKTFNHTRDYSKSDQYSENIQDESTRKIFEMARTQRDEIDAVETFANVLYDYGHQIPFDYQMDLARFISDESRHSEIGHYLLKEMGYDPFEIPCGLIGINVRSSLKPELAFAQINIFGESNQIKQLKDLAKDCYSKKIDIFSSAFDAIYSDEALHIKRGKKWIKEMSKGKSIKKIKQEARDASLMELNKQGISGEDYTVRLSDKDIGELIGE